MPLSWQKMTIWVTVFLLPSALGLTICGEALANAWQNIPLPPGVEYLLCMEVGESFIYGCMIDSSGESMGLCRTPLQAPGDWENLNCPSLYFRSMVVGGPGDSHILVPGPEGPTDIYGSTDAGASWAPRDSGILDNDWVMVVGSNGAFPGRLYATARHYGGYSIYRSDDFGNSWSRWGGEGVTEFQGLAIPFGDYSLGYAYEYDGNFDNWIRKTTNGGETWIRRGSYFLGAYYDIEVSVSQWLELFQDSGYSTLRWWIDDVRQPNIAIEGYTTFGVEVPLWQDGRLYVAGEDADLTAFVVHSVYPYDSWMSMNDGLPPDPLPDADYEHHKFHLKAAPQWPALILSLWGHGLWMRDMTDVVGALEPASIPGPVWVSDPAPNPTTGFTVLRINDSRPVMRAEILDIAGRVIRRPLTVDSRGYIRWNACTSDGHPVPSGTYFIRIKAGSQQAVARVTVIR